MNPRLTKVIAGAADGVLMLAMLLAWWVIVMLLAGFAEIITGWNLILTTAGGESWFVSGAAPANWRTPADLASPGG